MTVLPTAGDLIGGYRLIRVIGEGGMGVVWEAEQVSLSRRVALKLVRPALAVDPEFRSRFENEARVAASLDHPNVVTVHDSGESCGHLFLSMALVSGPSLRDVLDSEGTLSPARAAAVVSDVAAGLDAAHRASLVHRDVKPSNILLSIDQGRAVITDFGIAKALDATRATSTGQVLGTLNYMAPEQMSGASVGPRADVYSLGAVLFEMLVGKPPYERETAAATMFAHVNDEPPRPSLNPAVPKLMDAVVAQSLAKIPSERFSGPMALSAAAAAAVESDTNAVTLIAPVVDDQTKVLFDRLEQTRVQSPPGSRRPGSGPDGPGSEPTTPRFSATGSSSKKRVTGKRVAVGLVVLGMGVLAGTGGAVAVPSLIRSLTTTTTAVTTSTETTSQTTTETVTTSDYTDPSSTYSTSSGDLPVSLTSYAGDGFSVDVPDGWSKTDARLPTTRGDRWKWVNPDDPNTWVLVETTPNNDQSALDSAYSVRGSGSGPISPVTLGDNEGARWNFTYKHVDPPYQTDLRVDYFVNACSTGVAVLGSSSPSDFAYWAPTFGAVASSVTSDEYC